MKIKTVTIPPRQNVGVDWRKSRAFTEAVRKLVEEKGFAARGEQAHRNTVKIVRDFMVNVPKGEKEAARKALCAKAGINTRTYERWQAEVEQRDEIGASLFEKAEELGFDITASSIRSLADAKRLNPGKTPAEIVRKALAASDAERQAANREAKAEVDPKSALTEAINEYMRKSGDSIDGLAAVLKDLPFDTAEICKRLCR